IAHTVGPHQRRSAAAAITAFQAAARRPARPPLARAPAVSGEPMMDTPRTRSFEMATIPSARTGQSTEQGKLVEMSWDPITRIVGSLGIYTKIDFDNRRVAECYSTSSIFRGYSIFMQGKDPRDAHFITSRICGICGDNHATCSVYTQNMAFGIATPPMGEWII